MYDSKRADGENLEEFRNSLTSLNVNSLHVDKTIYNIDRFSQDGAYEDKYNAAVSDLKPKIIIFMLLVA